MHQPGDVSGKEHHRALRHDARQRHRGASEDVVTSKGRQCVGMDLYPYLPCVRRTDRCSDHEIHQKEVQKAQIRHEKKEEIVLLILTVQSLIRQDMNRYACRYR